MIKVLLLVMSMFSSAVAILNMNIPIPLEKSLKMTAQAMNNALPTMVDTEIRHDKVEVDGLTLMLKFTLVNFTKDIMDAQKLKDIMESDIRVQVCSDDDSKSMLKQGMKMIYDYTDKNSMHITQFVYDAKVCDLFTNLDQIKQTIVNIDRNEELTSI